MALAWIQYIDAADGVHIDNELPAPPVHGSGQPVPGQPPHASGQPLPGGGRPDNTLPGGGASTKPVPVPPGDNTIPPGAIWPPINRPGQALPGQPARPDQSLPAGGDGKFYCVVWVPGHGPKWTCIDLGLSAGNELPTAPARPDAGLPPAPARPGNELPGQPPAQNRPVPPGQPPVAGNQPPAGAPDRPGQQPGETPQPRQTPPRR